MRYIISFILCIGMYYANNLGGLNEQEWQITYDLCMQNNAKACDYLIDNGIVSVADCSDYQCSVAGMIYVGAGRYYEALEFFEKLCNLGKMDSCGTAGDIYYGLQDYFKARDYYQKSCKGKNGGGCYGLGLLYGQGYGVMYSVDKEKDLYKQSCNAKDPIGCYNLGVLYEQNATLKDNNKNAKEYYGKSCDYGYQGGCDRYREFNQVGIQ